MLDSSGTFAGAAAQEIREEIGLEIPADDLINLTELALEAPPSTNDNEDNTAAPEEHLQQGVYPSPGGCDEFIPIFLWQKRVPRGQLKKWEGKLTGLREEGEKISLRLCPLEKLWRVGGRDGKTLAGWALYEGLRREGKIAG